MIKVYGDILSGNCYKIKLLLHMLDIQHDWIHVDIMNAETHTDEFKAINPNAKIPALVLEDGQCLWESNAILNYLAEGSAFLPSKKFARSQVLQWQFFEQYSHEPYVAVARYLKLYLNLPQERLDEFEQKKQGAYKALSVMEKHLLKHSYFAADMFTIADISLYAYTHVAADGDIDLSQYPAINEWMQRIEVKLKHKTMQEFIDKEKKNVQSKEQVQRHLTSELEAKGAELVTTSNLGSVYDYSLTDINGHELALEEYKGHVLLLVNVASECGLTPQYAGLQKLYEQFKTQGLTVIGFPCNQFGAQEPGSELAIKRFCDLRYKTTFPMTSKIEVNGKGRHPLYDYLIGDGATFAGDITWNFEKFLIGKNGHVFKRFSPKTEPEDEAVINAIKQALF